jgi:hypothetical protein
MKHLFLNVSDLIAKVKSARQDVPDIEALRKVGVPGDGTSFMIKRAIYIFMAGDRTEDDGNSSVRPDSISPSKAGRYRRGAMSFRQKS